MRALFTGKRVAAAVALSVLAAGLIVLAWAWRSQPKADYSNIRPADYVGPQRCGECHERNFGLWKDHAHRRMNLTAGEDAVTADFSDAELRTVIEAEPFEFEPGTKFKYRTRVTGGWG